MHAATRSSQVTAARVAELASDPLLAQARNELAGGAPLQMYVFAVAHVGPSFSFGFVSCLHLCYAVLCHSNLTYKGFVCNLALNSISSKQQAMM